MISLARGVSAPATRAGADEAELDLILVPPTTPLLARGAAVAAEKHPLNLIRVVPAEGTPGLARPRIGSPGPVASSITPAFIEERRMSAQENRERPRRRA